MQSVYFFGLHVCVYEERYIYIYNLCTNKHIIYSVCTWTMAFVQVRKRSTRVKDLSLSLSLSLCLLLFIYMVISASRKQPVDARIAQWKEDPSGMKRKKRLRCEWTHQHHVGV